MTAIANYNNWKRAVVKENLDLSGAKYDLNFKIRKEFDPNDINDRNDFIESNMPIVIKEAKRYMDAFHCWDYVELDDLIQEGMLGLVSAADKFDATKGMSFCGFAIWQIGFYIKTFLYKNEMISKSQRFYENVKKILDAVKELKEVNGVSPSVEEISEHTKLHVDKICNLLEHMGGGLFDYDDDKRLLHSIVVKSKNSNDTGDICIDLFEQVERCRIVDDLLNQLSNKQRKVIEYRYGFNDTGEPMALRKVAKELGVTHNDIYLAELGALKKLRKICGKKRIEAEMVL